MSNELSKIIGNKRLILDGAIGTLLQKRVAEDYSCPEILNISHPHVLRQIHEEYFKCGSDAVETNTFGANTITLREFGLSERAYELSKASAEIVSGLAKKYSTPQGSRFALGSIGPGSKLPSLGDISFDELKQAYLPQIRGLKDGGVDGYLIETSQDILQIKAVLDAILDVSGHELPVMVSVTLDESGKMLPGTDLAAVITAFSGYSIASLGLNCGFGPEELHPYVKTLCQQSPFPVSIMPNAGLPRYENGKVVYPQRAEEFGPLMASIAGETGCEILGGCCGTTPEHIQALLKHLTMNDLRKCPEDIPSLASLFSVQNVDTDPKPLLIGERTNVTGSKKFRKALLADDSDTMMAMARQQIAEGAHVLDISLSYVGRNELKDMNAFLERLNQESLIPLQPDTSSPEVMAAALKRISGRAVINSVNLENGEEHFLKIANLCKRFGAMLICLTIDEDGMAKSAEQKIQIAQRMVKLAERAGLRPKDLFIDMLTFTLGGGDEDSRNSAIETLSAIAALKKQCPRVHTVLGVSNVSYGLQPSLRKALNAVFLHRAVKVGLDAAIVHAGKLVPLNDIPENILKSCYNLIDNQQNNGDPLEELLSQGSGFTVKRSISHVTLSPEDRLSDAVIHGDKSCMADCLSELKEQYPAKEIINDLMLPAMNEVGRRFNDGSMQLPFVLKSASAMQTGIKYLTPFLQRKEADDKGSIVLATVKGDVHDIGKNLVKIVFESHGYTIHDLGVKQSIQAIIHAYETYRPDMIGMSGLLVQSAHIMKENLKALSEKNISVPVLIGGAALNREFVESDLQPEYGGRVFYADDAFQGLQITERIKRND